ncbi:MAG: hypothetical protein JOY54_02985 [Acidobacteriaceae bacterium]|nr:hypothetical protein [Acidobacteriaceae bacterium]
MTSDASCEGPLRLAVRHLFNSDLSASQRLLKEYVAAKPQDPLGYSLSAAVPFYNLVANQLSTHYANSIRSMISGGRIGVPPAMLLELGNNLQRSKTQAQLDLSSNPKDENAAFALCVAAGVERDIAALAFKRWMVSFQHAKTATLRARHLLALNPEAYDAYFVIGFSEHLIQEIPMIFRPFAKIPGIVGQTSRAIQFLEAAATGGQYFREFARQTLLTVYSEAGRQDDVSRILYGLTKEFPGNDRYRAEWTKLRAANRNVS